MDLGCCRLSGPVCRIELLRRGKVLCRMMATMFRRTHLHSSSVEPHSCFTELLPLPLFTPLILLAGLRLPEKYNSDQFNRCGVGLVGGRHGVQITGGVLLEESLVVTGSVLCVSGKHASLAPLIQGDCRDNDSSNDDLLNRVGQLQSSTSTGDDLHQQGASQRAEYRPATTV